MKVQLVFCGLAFAVSVCGLGVKDKTGRVTSGDEATPGQFPYQVSLQWDGALIRSHTCGGAILNEHWIITAAHCVVDRPTIGHFVIVAGENNLKVVEGTEQEGRVRFLVVHPDYPTNAVVDANDVALIKLTEPLVFDDHVQAINLPEEGVVPSGAALLSGWGVSGGLILPTHPDILQFAAVTIEHLADCKSHFPEASLFNTTICSRGRVATCSEDDGSPLVRTREDGSYELVGIVTWPTDPCGESTQPNVYAQVSSFVDFIARNIVN